MLALKNLGRLTVLAFGVVVACAAAPSQSSQEPASVHRVLFIGNSLTSYNDLPGLVAALAAADGTVFESRAVTANNFSLEDHWNRGTARRTIEQGGWSAVVLQQGPSALPESQVLLREYTRRFDADIRRAGARTALYMVWPSRARAFDFQGVSESYAAAAREVNGMLLPVGDAWREAWRLDTGLALYGPDDFHPSPPGSYLAALVIYQGLSGRSPVGLPADLVVGPAGLTRVTIDPVVASLLQRAAAAMNAGGRQLPNATVSPRSVVSPAARSSR
jgi:hypothetical protein